MKTLTAKVVPIYKKSDRLIEMIQSKSMKFAFAKHEDGSDLIEQVMPYVKCRDFLKEQILFTHYGRHQQIYGFSTKCCEPNAKDYTGLLLTIPNADEYANVLANFDILTTYEKTLGFTQLSELFVLDKETLFVKADAIWQQSCLLISLYSLLLRTLCYPLDKTFESVTTTSVNTVDTNYWRAMDGFKKIKSRDDLLRLIAVEDVKTKNTDFIHNLSGAYYMLTSLASMKQHGFDYMAQEFNNYPVWVENWK